MPRQMRFCLLASLFLAACAAPPTDSAPTATAPPTQPSSTNVPPTPKGPAATPTLDPYVPTDTPIPTVEPVVTGRYLMSFHACDTASTSDCHNPQNHFTYLAQGDDGSSWSLVPGWEPFNGSVPDVIRRGDTLYVFTARNELVRYHLDTNTQDAPAAVSVTGLQAGFVDPSLILDEQGRLVLFFLPGKPGADPAGCAPNETSCENSFRSATEVEGSDGTRFTLDDGDRTTVTLSSTGGLRSASDPDIFFDGTQYVLYTSHGPSIAVWTSLDLRGTYTRVSIPPADFLSQGAGGIASGFLDPTSAQYWTYAHVEQAGRAVIRRAMHAGLTQPLGDSKWTVVISAEGLGLPATANVESPGFAVNE